MGVSTSSRPSGSSLARKGFFVEKDNEDVKFHTNQGIILCIFDIAVSIVASILGVFHWIPFVGWVFSLIATLLWLLVAAMVILGIVHAAKGERTPLPVLGKLFTFIK